MKLFTIGTSRREWGEFLKLLLESGITLVLDLRSSPGSYVRHFDEKRYGALSTGLKAAGIRYDDSLHRILGGSQNGKQTLPNFRQYAKTPEFFDALRQLNAVVRDNMSGGTAILCCELKPQDCHRSIVAEELAKYVPGLEVIHLGDPPPESKR